MNWPMLDELVSDQRLGQLQHHALLHANYLRFCFMFADSHLAFSVVDSVRPSGFSGTLSRTDAAPCYTI